jgi:glycerate-2-kinase
MALGVAAGLDAETALDHNDSASYLESIGAEITTGPTGTNVGDLGVAARTPA